MIKQDYMSAHKFVEGHKEVSKVVHAHPMGNKM